MTLKMLHLMKKVRERQILYEITYMYDLKNNENECIQQSEQTHRQETN